MKTAVLTATCRHGGLDVSFNSMMAGTVKPDVWVIADDLYEERWEEVDDRTHDSGIEVVHYRPRIKPDGYFSDLAGHYNAMTKHAIERGCELAISLQDFIWVPERGIEKYVTHYEQNELALVSGLCSHTQDPAPDTVTNWQGGWSLWDEPYQGPPKEIYWLDVRGGFYPQDQIVSSDLMHWELNWAAWPLSIQTEHDIWYDESYGQGIAYENQQLAMDVFLRLDRTPLIDVSNHALSLPHKKYWPDEEARGLPHALANKDRHERKYNTFLGLIDANRGG